MKIITIPYDEMSRRFNTLENDIEQIRQILQKQASYSTNNETGIYLNKKQAAQIANVSKSTIDNWGRAGYITRHYFGSAVRFSKEELLKYLESKKITNVV